MCGRCDATWTSKQWQRVAFAELKQSLHPGNRLSKVSEKCGLAKEGLVRPSDYAGNTEQIGEERAGYR